VPETRSVVGSIVNPILGALPEAFIVIFAGTRVSESAMSIGIGSCSGCTVMLLTVPWFVAILGGRVDLHPQTRKPIYFRTAHAMQGKLSPENQWSFTMSGISIVHGIRRTALIMVVTTTPLIVAQFTGRS